MDKHYQDKDIKAAFDEVFESNDWWHYNGPRVRVFEADFAKAHDSNYAVSVANGTVALDIILQTIGLGTGDEVILPAYNFYSLPKNILKTGATPVFADVVADNFTLDAKQIEAKITEKTKAIIVVHISSSVPELDKIKALAQKHQLCLIEDCAQAHGAIYDGKKVGCWGDFGIFSFGGVKLMTAGQGGMLTMPDETNYLKCFAICNRGLLPNGQMNTFDLIGENYQLSTLQAALLVPQLKKLDALGEQREKACRYLDEQISTIKGLRPIQQFPKTERRSQMRYAFLAETHLHEQIVQTLAKKDISIMAGHRTVQTEERLQGKFNSKEQFPYANSAQDEILSIHHTFLLKPQADLDQFIATIKLAINV